MANTSILKRRQAAGIGKLLALILIFGGVTVASASVLPFIEFEAQSPNDNSPPFAPAVTIAPDLPGTTDDLVCSITTPGSDPDGDEITYTYQWHKDDEPQEGLTTSTLDSSHTTKNQIWKCVVTATDGTDVSAAASDEVTILNTTPTTPVVDVTPDFPVTTDDLVCSIISLSTDADEDDLVYTYQWYNNGVQQTELSTNTVNFSLTAPGDTWKCVIISSDREDSNAGSFDEVTIVNRDPIAPVLNITPDFPVTTDDLVCSIITDSSDPEGDTIVYTYQWYKDDVVQKDLTTNTVGSSYTSKTEVWKCVVNASDGTGAGAHAFDEVTIHNSPPSAPVIDVTPDHPDAGDNLLCWIMIAGSDSDGDEVIYTYQWYKNGELQTDLTANIIDSSYTTEDDVWRCVVTAHDGTVGTAATFEEVTVGDDTANSPPSPPVVNVTPDLPVTTDDLICSITTLSTDPDGDIVTYAYQWHKDDVLQEDLTTSIVSSNYTAKGQVWECVVTASDGIDTSSGGLDEVIIHNSVPTAPAVDVTPDSPTTMDDLVCTITTASSDPDGDTVTYSYQWHKDNALQGSLNTNTVDSNHIAKDQVWRCVVTASDGIDTSSGGLDEVTILNTSPTAPAVDVTPNSPVTIDDITCDIATASSDPDGDTVTYSYQWYKDDDLQGSLTTNTVHSDYTAKDQVWKCVAKASDGINSSAGGFESVTIYNSPPTTPRVDVIPNAPNTDDNLLCTITTQSSDPDTGDSISYSYAWYMNDALQSDLTTKSVPSSRTDNGETWKCVVIASDGIDNSSGGSDQVNVNEQSSKATYYVDASNGSDDYNGRTTDTPFRTIGKAADVVQAGDVVHIRGGVYYLGGRLTFDRSGTSGNPIIFEAYPGETPIIDGSSASLGGWQPPLVRVSANWNIFKNIEVRQSPGRGIYVTGDDNVFECILTHHNGGSGVNVSGGNDNQFLYVTAHNNYDPGDSGHHADGVSISSGTVNILRGCLFYENSDDGLDTWESSGNTIENCVAYDNGYDDGDGNGFKLGPGGNNYVTKCISFTNGTTGFTNNQGANNIIENCTAYNNGTNNFESYNTVNTFRNNIAYGRVGMYAPTPIQSHNTWNLDIDDPQFLSTDPASPDFLSLSSNSPCRGAGEDSSDLGALQYGERITDLVINY